jgi:hypothetical protein
MAFQRSLALLAFGVACLGHADDRFASSVVDYSNLGSGIYGSPEATLGKPTTWIKDTQNGGTDHKIAASLIYGAWNTAPDGLALITTIKTGGYLTVRFDSPITNDASHWYGMDFIVFGNSFFSGSTSAKWDSNMDSITIASSGVAAEPTTVSVSPDGVSWYTYSAPTADTLWPTQAFNWDSTAHAWGTESDWTKPVDPSLNASSLTGKTVAQAIGLYNGSAGGTAFDIGVTGFSSISYIRFTGSGGEIDGISRVSSVPEPSALAALGVGLVALIRKRKTSKGDSK